MPNRHFKIPIHVKPYVKKYIVVNYTDSILISMRNPASIVLYSCLQKQNIPFRVNSQVLEKRFSELSQTISLLIQCRDRYKHGLFIQPANELLINAYFEQEILNRIFAQCEAYGKAKLPLPMAVEDFCDQYDIELHKDLSLEAVLKSEYRHRQTKKKTKDRANLSTPLTA